MSLNYINITGIFERQDILFDFENSPFFLVGPNGTGKSTALKILQCVLTGQWSRLSEAPFASIEANINGSTITLEKSDFSQIDRTKFYVSRGGRRFPSRRKQSLLPEKWGTAKEILISDSFASSSGSRKLPQNVIDQFEANYEAIAILSNTVDIETRGKVLYFPTYRRIERDINELFEVGDEDEIQFEEKTLAPKIAARFKAAGEVIGFGGQDIRALLGEVASRIEVESRRALNEHSFRFLEAISTNSADINKTARNMILSEQKTDKLLDRISVSTSSKIDIQSIKHSLSAVRAKITKNKPGRLSQQQEMLIYYVGELIKTNERVDALAAPLSKFSQLITKYLKPVKTSFLREADNRVIILDQSENEIELDQLSSGEKQILAFFAFLTLDDGLRSNYIIIDEPELSLSVSW